MLCIESITIGRNQTVKVRHRTGQYPRHVFVYSRHSCGSEHEAGTFAISNKFVSKNELFRVAAYAINSFSTTNRLKILLYINYQLDALSIIYS